MKRKQKPMWRHLMLVTAALVIVSGCTISAGLKKKPTALEPGATEQERTPVYHLGDWTIARASMHNHTIYSDGCRTPEDLLELARIQGMAILAYNDHREGKICAGKSGAVCVRTGGVEDVGYEKYFDHLRRIQEQAGAQDMIVLKGIEVIPYFYNYGKVPALVLDGLQKHFTVYGIENEKVFYDMPTRNSLPLSPEAIPDDAPRAAFVDYIAKNGGIVHAVHVEEGADMWIGPAHGACPPPVWNLHSLKNLTGFSVLPSGWHEKAGGPGGLWDTNLLEYLGGLRERPMWAMADADYHCEAGLAIATTLHYMKEFTEAEVYRCLREGRMVALQGDAFQDSYVSEWWASDSGRPADVIMLGREITIKNAPTIRFSLDHPVAGLRTLLIRNGVVIMESEGSDITYVDKEAGIRGEPAYYRVEVIGPRAERGPYEGPTMPDSVLFTNPVFVRFAS